MPNPGAPLPEALKLDLYDAYLPALTAGLHRIVVQQSIGYERPAGTPQAHHYRRDEAFVVRGPRFLVDENDIHARSPAQGAMGDFHRHIAHIVLRKRALPWERELAAGEGPRVPWMALLLLTEAEFQAQGGEEAVRVMAPTALFAPGRRSADGTVLLPRLDEEPGNEAGDLRVNILDLDRDLARRLCPSRADLARLAHVRRVAMDDKPRAAMHGEGEFPVVCAGRIPAPGANIALLVSLEGWEELVEEAGGAPPSKPSLPEGPGRLRLVVLTRWRFTHDPAAAHSFPAAARGLDTGLLRLASPPGTPESVARPLAAGYTPLPYRTAGGGATLAWYRGPFAPAPVPPLPVDTFAHADAALIVSPEDGSLTLSYAAAWQLGRLLALASPGFLAATRAFIADDAGPREVAFRLDTFMRTHLRAIQREWAADPAPPAAEEADTPGYFRAAMQMLDWLHGLMTLQSVPFSYLVAGEGLLPVASLRYFHLDPNWLLALANGALSLSGTATGDAAAAGPSMRRLLSRLLERCEARAAAEPDPPGTGLDRPRTGFLLRSTLVSDWPGLETVVATAPPSARPLRLERLAGDILLGIAEGQIVSLTFKEPPEGLVLRLGEPHRGVPEPDAERRFSPLARLRAEQALGQTRGGPAMPSGPAPDPLSAAAFVAASVGSGSCQTFIWEIAP
ncbi:hypothetical protein KHC23_08330 [Ancylobacter dichloromethanicus]|uniref:Uncharacterized protein n=1 Tax=Ancylobacter dichloromethanicus TaxID=518825 RepID=A0A9W6JB25_9HYPH|nr:hypothetical protein [Ancylobacter dichloromethanicus]MBS7553655.1 hypothetical protein [Ancylobacter dichloromethanicus]GLK72719.1 hypothetical protein GCM10017643_28350 [Ancylobacter dichloromethanicus]